MIIDVFFTTRDKVALHTFSLVIKAHQEWRKSLLNICAQHGFESFCGPDFCTPDYFLQERFSQKLRGRGLTRYMTSQYTLNPIMKCSLSDAIILLVQRYIVRLMICREQHWSL